MIDIDICVSLTKLSFHGVSIGDMVCTRIRDFMPSFDFNKTFNAAILQRWLSDGGVLVLLIVNRMHTILTVCIIYYVFFSHISVIIHIVDIFLFDSCM
jgi:hypothetical protein